jgi:hypothetical protein
LELQFVSHNTATGLHHNTASEAARPARHRLFCARELFFPLHFYFIFGISSLACRTNIVLSFCMQVDRRGKIIPPRFVSFLGQAGSGLAMMFGPGPA